MRTLLLVVGALVAAGCARSVPRVAADGPRETRYRVGDYVVYRYSGASLPAPVLLREEVAAREGLRLRLDVEATRGEESRRWIQIVTDTPENQRGNVLDALYEVRDGVPVRLPNEGNRDVLRLSDWFVLMPEGRAEDVRTAPCVESIAGESFECTCTVGRNRWQGRPVRFRGSECPGFLWTNGPGGFSTDPEGEVVLAVEVVEHGRRAGARPLAMDPTAGR